MNFLIDTKVGKLISVNQLVTVMVFRRFLLPYILEDILLQKAINCMKSDST